MLMQCVNRAAVAGWNAEGAGRYRIQRESLVNLLKQRLETRAGAGL